jgi:hypothetical protein
VAELPETQETTSNSGHLWWTVRDRSICWERPLRKSDFAALGDAAPDGPILGVRTADEGEKWALIESDPEVFFTTPHFDGYPAVLVNLRAIRMPMLREVITDAWLDRAPKRLVRALLG